MSHTALNVTNRGQQHDFFFITFIYLFVYPFIQFILPLCCPPLFKYCRAPQIFLHLQTTSDGFRRCRVFHTYMQLEHSDGVNISASAESTNTHKKVFTRHNLNWTFSSDSLLTCNTLNLKINHYSFCISNNVFCSSLVTGLVLV